MVPAFMGTHLEYEECTVITEVFMPKMSDHMEMGVILSWLVKEGDSVKEGQPIAELETDKATGELEAPGRGFLKGIRKGVEIGTQVPVGETIAFIVSSFEEPIPQLPPLGDAVTESIPEPSHPISASEKTDDLRVRSTPAVRRIARELGVDINQVVGSGPQNRVLEVDIHAIRSASKPTQPDTPPRSVTISPVARRMADDLGVDVEKVRPGTDPARITKDDIRAYLSSGEDIKASIQSTSEDFEWAELTRTQVITGQRMLESVRQAPQFLLSVNVDMTRALEIKNALSEQIKRQIGVRLTVTGLLVKVVATALKKYPRANASFMDGRIQLHKQVNIGVAMGADDGLIVPVIHHAEACDLTDITLQLNTLQDKAKAKSFRIEELKGGTFTISNLEMYGIDWFQAILNPPESAILAVGRIIKTPIVLPDSSIQARPMMNLTLTVDHRSLDGMQAAKFLALLKEYLEQPLLLL